MLRRISLSGVQRCVSILLVISLVTSLFPSTVFTAAPVPQPSASSSALPPSSSAGEPLRKATPVSYALAAPNSLAPHQIGLEEMKTPGPDTVTAFTTTEAIATPLIGGYLGTNNWLGTSGKVAQESSAGQWTKLADIGWSVKQIVRSHKGTYYAVVLPQENFFYAGALYKSTDGSNWTWLYGKDGAHPNDLGSVNQVAVVGDALFIAVAGHHVEAGGQDYSGIYVSGDEGAHFYKIFTPDKHSYYIDHVMSISVSPANGNYMWASTNACFQSWANDDIYKSENGGLSWTRVFITSTAIIGVFADPKSPRAAYAVCASGVERTTDGGTTWSQTVPTTGNDYNRMDQQRLAIEVTGDSTKLWLARGFPGALGNGVEAITIDSQDNITSTHSTILTASGDEAICAIRRASDGALWAGADSGDDINGNQNLFKSTDGGQTWTDMTGDMADAGSSLHDSKGPMRIKAIMSEGLPPDPRAWYGWQNGKLLGCPECLNAMFNEPVNTTTGNFFYGCEDLSIPGPGGQPMVIERSYNSLDTSTLGPFGRGWMLNYSASLKELTDDSVMLKDGDGRVFVFQRNPDGTYSSPPGSRNTLTKNEDSTFTSKLEDQTVLDFDAGGRLTSIVDKNSNELSFTYDGEELASLTEVTGANNRTLTFEYNTDGFISQIADPLNRTIQYSYTDGDLTSVIDMAGKVTTLTYDDAHHLLTIIDANGHTQADNTYDDLGRVISQRDAKQNETSFSYSSLYDPVNRTTVITDARGGVSRYYYDENYRTITETNQLGRSQSYVYDDNDNRVQVTNLNGEVGKMSYDANGNLTGIYDPLGYTRNFTYDSNNNMIAKWWTLENSQNLLANDNFENWTGSSLNNWTVAGSPGLSKETSIPNLRYGLASAKLSSATPVEGVIKQTVDVSPSTTYVISYDVKSQGLTGTGPHGKVVVSEVDSSGVVVADRTGVFANITGDNDWSGKSASFTTGSTTVKVTVKAVLGYNSTASGTVWFDGITIEPGSTASAYSKGESYGYDEQGNLTSVTDAMGKVTTFDYDEHGNQISVTDPLSRTTSFGYDDYGNLISITDPDGKVQTREYDQVGRLIEATDPLSHTVSFGYDDQNRLTSVTDALGHASYAEYDDVGNRTVVTDTNGNATRFTYDEKNNLKTTTDALGNVTTYDYDSHDNLMSVTDALTHTTSYEYDLTDRLIALTDPLDNVTRYGYDAIGNTTVITDANGHVTHFDYDADNNLTLITYPDSTVQYTYDSLGNPTKMTDQYGSTTYTYNALSQLLKVKRPGGLTVQYTYDDAGQRTSMTYPDTTKTVEYEYNSRGLLTQLSDWASRVMTYTWDDAGRLGGFHYPNNTDTTYTYDDANRLIGIAATGPGGATINSFSYELDNVGNRLVMTDTEGTTAHTYDDLYRLTGVAYPDSTSEEFQYDPVGNRTVMTSTSGTTNYSYDDADRLESAGSTTYTWDDNGNLKTKTIGANTFSYSYDYANQLTEVSGGGGGVHSYQYYGDGLRKRATDRGVVTNYTWDVALPVPVIISDTINAYRYGVDLAWAGGAGTTSYYHSDGLGSIRDLTGPTGSVVGSYSYYAFGGVRSTSGSRENPFRFAGEQLEDTGLYFLRARYYDPTTGRFVTKDPAGGVATLPGTLNPYPYALNNPVNNTDPSGEFLDTILDFGFIAYDIYRIGADNIFGKEDNLGENLLALGADAFCAATPFCSGGGMAVRGTRLVAREAEHALPEVTRLTRAGKYPSWTTVRGRMNRLEVERDPGLWSQEDVARMREGRNPAGYEWHHNNGRGGPDPHNPVNLRLLPRDEHRAIHYGRPRP